MELDLEHPLTSDSVPSLFLIESEHMPSYNYLQTLKASDSDISVRGEAISSILQHSSKFYDPSLRYLAINYLDRFLSSQEMPRPKPCVLQLMAVSCVSLAAKMKNAEIPLSDFQGDEGILFDRQTIERMENVILGALKWRMRSITPFSFLSFFVTLFDLKDLPLRQALKARATDIILNAQHDAKFLEFKPSVVASAALLSASYELFPLQFSSFTRTTCNCSYVNKENLMECYKAMQERGALLDNASSSETPINVLDQQFSGSESYDGTVTTANPTSKRRKTSGCC